MSGLLPVALYGVEVPPGEMLIPAAIDFPATIRITMAAIDPSEEPEADDKGDVPRVPRSTLKIVKERIGGDDDDDEDDMDESYLQELLANGEEDDSEESDEEANGGPSDPAKSKKARQEAAIKKLMDSVKAEEDSDEEMADGETNGTKSKKGKAPATEDDGDSDEESDSDEGVDLETHVICTLDLERNFQQPLDLVIGENERAYFTVSGTHSVHLTGNYVVPADSDSDESDEDDEDYDLPPDMDELVGDDEEVSDDELDAIELAADRIAEVDTDEEEAPKLVKSSKKSKKRPAEDEADDVEEPVTKSEKTEEADAKLSKKQLKKLKNNKGAAVAVEETAAPKKDKETTPSKGDKKVQFAKNLEQGPTGSAEKPKAGLGVKVVRGVTIDDRKLGQGRVANNGDKVSMRYIGKLQNGKVFDANKKGTPFSFKLGKGEVIKGWDIGVAGMAVGGERRLTIPPSLAYGASGTPGIPANSTLVFDVKLLEIK